MGFHDYTDYIQHNGQTLVPLELNDGSESDSDAEYDVSCGSSEAILVKVPSTHSIRDIISWPLSEFKKYDTIRATYDFDVWDFTNVAGYGELISGPSTEWWNTAIWQSPDHPGYWLVNFEPGAYDVFVVDAQTDTLRRVPRAYLRQVYDNRGLPTPRKELAIAHILEPGQDNLWEYDGLKSAQYEVPDEYVELSNQPLSRVVYSLRPVGGVCKERLRILIRDHCVIPHMTMPSASIGAQVRQWAIISSKYENYGPTSCAIEFALKQQMADIDDILSTLRSTCVMCNDTRWAGHMVCIEHIGQPAEDLVKARQEKITDACMRSISDIREAISAKPPAEITCEFIERGKKYVVNMTKIA